MFTWGTAKENRKNEGKETLIDASRTVLLMFGFLGFWVSLFCFSYLVLWLFLNTNQRRRWDAKKEIDRTFQNSSVIYLPHNECVTCIAPLAHFLLESNATSKKCDNSNVKSTLLFCWALYHRFPFLFFNKRKYIPYSNSIIPISFSFSYSYALLPCAFAHKLKRAFLWRMERY